MSIVVLPKLLLHCTPLQLPSLPSCWLEMVDMQSILSGKLQAGRLTCIVCMNYYFLILQVILYKNIHPSCYIRIKVSLLFFLTYFKREIFSRHFFMVSSKISLLFSDYWGKMVRDFFPLPNRRLCISGVSNVLLQTTDLAGFPVRPSICGRLVESSPQIFQFRIYTNLCLDAIIFTWFIRILKVVIMKYLEKKAVLNAWQLFSSSNLFLQS